MKNENVQVAVDMMVCLAKGETIAPSEAQRSAAIDILATLAFGNRPELAVVKTFAEDLKVARDGGHPTVTHAKVAHAVDVAIARIRNSGNPRLDEWDAYALKTLEICVRTELGLHPDETVEAQFYRKHIDVRALGVVVSKEV